MVNLKNKYLHIMHSTKCSSVMNIGDQYNIKFLLLPNTWYY